MTQDQVVELLLKIGIVSGFFSLVAWVAVYTLLAPWWHNPIGRTLVVKSLLIAALLVPFGLSLFFNLSRLDSRVTAWVDVTLIGAITPVMIWRTVVWLHESQLSRADIKARLKAKLALCARPRRKTPPTTAPVAEAPNHDPV